MKRRRRQKSSAQPGIPKPAPTQRDKAPNRLPRLAAALLMSVGFVLAATAAARKSVTVDEYQALPHGLAMLRTGDFHLATGVPALPSVLAALPLLLVPARLDTAPFAAYVSSWQVGRQFMLENLDRYHDWFLCGRLVSLAMLLVAWLLTWRLAQSLYGPIGGLLAAAVACLSPNLLAHGALVTPDIYLTAALMGSLWAFDRLIRRPGLVAGSLLGLALGLACLSKLTGGLLLGFYPLVLAGMHLAQHLPRGAGLEGATVNRRSWLSLAASLVMAVAVINLGYLGQGSFTPLGEYKFETGGFRWLAGHLPDWLPVPLPYPFFVGIDVQLAETGYVAYLQGEFNETGFWNYYLVGLLVKTPLPMLVLLAAAWVAGGRINRREVPLLVLAAAMFGFFSFAGHKNIGMRYLLFLEPMMAVWIARLAASRWWSAHGRRSQVLQYGSAAAAAAMVLVALTSWPHYLAYFNLASGGPSQGHRYLLDSNLDWGQDLIELGQFMERRGIESIDLAYFGRVRPEVYGINYQHLGTEPPQRYAAISANLLWGRMYFINGTAYWPDDQDTFAAYRELEAEEVVGHTIYVFDTWGKEAQGN